MSDMLEKYSLSFNGKMNGKKDYELKFKVAKGVRVTFEEDGDLNKIQLNWDSTSGNDNYNKAYKVSGPLKVQFFQNPAVGAGKDGSAPSALDDGPIIEIRP